ncbi:vacuolar protein sorting-associated protein 9, putative [Plasmodium gallinaceum]|uniref:Vacuolar protein sorting-associated protein 9, putative n=1 Tax=Plasmodium gallinaceum TaxID=5849 RepID=A0A1J1GL77_PLAGA|nr:vacuolar protein sorting-associated protein 9, putative [Plasmodium gallinaceum]CRG93160.1 vacuolar protein sorting-associated protein 9, putative [Plasmodium gallinaceum]
MNNKAEYDDHFIFSNEWDELTYKRPDKGILNKNNNIAKDMNDMDFFFDNFENNNEKPNNENVKNEKINRDTTVNTFNDSLWLESDSSNISINKTQEEHKNITNNCENSYKMNENINNRDDLGFPIDKKVDINPKLDLWENNNNYVPNNNSMREKKTNFYNYKCNAEIFDSDMFPIQENNITTTMNKNNLKLDYPQYIFNEYNIGDNHIQDENNALNDINFDVNIYPNEDTINVNNENKNDKDMSTNEQNKIHKNSNENKNEASKNMNVEYNNKKGYTHDSIRKKKTNDVFINNSNLDFDTRSGASDKTCNDSSINNCSIYINKSNDNHSFDKNMIHKSINDNELINKSNRSENVDCNQNEKKNSSAKLLSKDKMDAKKTKKIVSKKSINSNSSLESSINTVNSSISDDKNIKLKKKKKKTSHSDIMTRSLTLSDNLDDTKNIFQGNKNMKLKDTSTQSVNSNQEEKKIRKKKQKNCTSSDENMIDTRKVSDEKKFFSEIKEYLDNKNTKEINVKQINENNLTYDIDIKNNSKEKTKTSKKQLSPSKESSSKGKIKKKEKKVILKQNNSNIQKTNEKQKTNENKCKKVNTDNSHGSSLTEEKNILNIKNKCENTEDSEINITNYFEIRNDEKDILKKNSLDIIINSSNTKNVKLNSFNHMNTSTKNKSDLPDDHDTSFNNNDYCDEIIQYNSSNEKIKNETSINQTYEKNYAYASNESYIEKIDQINLRKSKSYSEDTYFQEECYQKHHTPLQEEMETKYIEKERKTKTKDNENKTEIKDIEKDWTKKGFIKRIKKEKESEKSKYIEEEIKRNRNIIQNEEIDKIIDIKQGKSNNEEIEKEENIKNSYEENTTKSRSNIQQKSRKIKDIFISFIKRDDSKKNEDTLEKNAENKKMLKKENTRFDEIKLNKRNESEKNKTNFYNLKKKSYDEDDEKSKKKLFSKKKFFSDASHDFIQNEYIKKENILEKNIIINNESDEKSVYIPPKENINSDNTLETNSVIKKRPNTLYNNFLESLKHPSCKNVVEKVKNFILKFPQNLSREKAANKIHNFISETQPILLNSEIYKNLNKYQINMIIEGYEKFIMQKLYFHLYQMDTKDKDEDEKIYTKINCLQWVELKHLEVIEEINLDRLQIAQRELLRIQKMKAPNDKLIMILNCCRIVTSVLYEAKKNHKKNKINKKKLLNSNSEYNKSNLDDNIDEKNKQDLINKYIKNIIENNHINSSKKNIEGNNGDNTKGDTTYENSNDYEYPEEVQNKNNYQYLEENENKDTLNNNSNDNINKSLKLSKKYLNTDTVIESDDELLPCADEVLPVLIFVIIKTNPPELISNIAYIQNFRHPSHFVSEEAYSFTQFCSGIEFIKELGKTTFLNISEDEYKKKVSEAEKLYLNEVKESNKKLQEAAGKLNELIKYSNEKNVYNNIVNKIESLNLNFEKTENLDSISISNLSLFFEEYKTLVKLKNDILKEVQDHFNENTNQK